MSKDKGSPGRSDTALFSYGPEPLRADLWGPSAVQGTQPNTRRLKCAIGLRFLTEAPASQETYLRHTLVWFSPVPLPLSF